MLQQKENKRILLFLAVYFSVLLVLCFINDKGEFHLSTIHYQNSFFNQIFKYGTNLGDGVTVAIVVVILLLFVSYKDALTLATSSIVMAGVVQFLKRVVFDDALRPYLYFKKKGIDIVSAIPPEEINKFHSFPSGHSAASFTLFLFLALIVKRVSLKWLIIFIGVLSSFSRVYLSEHFWIDITVGGIIGSITVVFTVLVYEKNGILQEGNRWNNSIFIKKL